MKLFCILLLFVIQPPKEVPDEEKIRRLFNESVNEKKKAIELVAYIDMCKTTSLSLGYQGAAKMLLAKFESNVFKKYDLFQEGKVEIERAIQMDPESVELRFIRFSCQSNIPWFLNYRCSLKNDKEILVQSIKQNNSRIEPIRKQIVSALVQSSE